MRTRLTAADGAGLAATQIGSVSRPVAVRIEALDVHGRSRTIDAEGSLASLMQHEIDHLDGILTLDRADPAERRRALTALLDDEGRRDSQAA